MTQKENRKGSAYHSADRLREIAYYKRIATECGISRLRETDALSRLIAERRQAEEALKKARAELEQRVIERTAALSMANTALKREIRKRERANAELAESEEKYRAMFKDSPDAISLTQDGIIMDVNPAWLNLHGYETSKEVIGRDIVNFVHRADHHKLDTGTGKHSWPDIAKHGFSVRDIRKDGSTVDVEIYSSCIKIGGRGVILSTVRDLTERNKAETEKLALETRLRQSEKMEAIGALASSVAHDLNNILSGLISYPELLLFDLPDDSPIRDPIATIKKSGEKASAIVQDLLTLARRGVEITHTVDLNQIIADYLESPEFERLIGFHNKISISQDLSSDLRNIMGSAVHLSKTVMNLVSNAAEAMPRGGTIRITTRNYTADDMPKDKTALPKGDYILLEIRDTGIGIAQTDIARIFEPFYTKKVMGRSGTGLGMAVVWGTVQDHHGFIEVDSVVGEGTRFSLYFPSTFQQLQLNAGHKSIEIPLGSGETILIVDDVVEQRDIASRILKRLGYKVVSVMSGEAAIEYMQHHCVDLLLLDMMMDPGIDGYDTYQRILEINPDQHALIASGYTQSDRVQKAMGLGNCGYVKKPYSLEGIATAVRDALGARPTGTTQV